MDGRLMICYIGEKGNKYKERDYDMIKRNFDTCYNEIQKGDWLRYIAELAIKVRKCRVVYTWKAGWHSLIALIIARIYRKKIVVAAGGHDVASIPEIDYGAFADGHFLREGLPARVVLNHADVILAISKSACGEIYRRANPKRVKVVYCGASPDMFAVGKKKEEMVVTVSALSWENVRRKGVDRFVIAARYFNIPFVVIGKFVDDSIEYLRSIAPENVVFTGYIEDDELANWLQRAKVYAQLSKHEGFGISVAEAMLCGCIPVVTRVYALPEVVGDAGFYASDAVEAITNALGAPESLGIEARERILRLFSLDKREKELVKIIKEVK